MTTKRTKAQLYHKIAHMESVNDHLEAEIAHLDILLKGIGFKEGLITFKRVAEMLQEDERSDICCE